MLTSLVDDRYTDKNTIHSYLPLYDELFASRKERARAVLEVGVYHGGSITLWHQYFSNAVVMGVDITVEAPPLFSNLQQWPRVQLLLGVDAYTAETITKIGTICGKLDVVLDDGPHTLESMRAFIQLYLPLIADDGILVIEDVQDFTWFKELCSFVPADLQAAIQMYDRRSLKGRYDDMVFVVNKALLK